MRGPVKRVQFPFSRFPPVKYRCPLSCHGNATRLAALSTRGRACARPICACGDGSRVQRRDFDVHPFPLDARNGKRLWTFNDGKYTPVVADAERLYLVGHARVYGMVEE